MHDKYNKFLYGGTLLSSYFCYTITYGGNNTAKFVPSHVSFSDFELKPLEQTVVIAGLQLQQIAVISMDR